MSDRSFTLGEPIDPTFAAIVAADPTLAAMFATEPTGAPQAAEPVADRESPKCDACHTAYRAPSFLYCYPCLSAELARHQAAANDAEPVAESAEPVAEPSPFRHLSGPHTIAWESATIGKYYVVARIVDDSDPDTSYLDQDAPDCDFRDRKAAYLRGDFTFHTVLVQVFAEDGDDDQVLAQDSLSGIESDSDRSYWATVAAELAEEAIDGLGE